MTNNQLTKGSFDKVQPQVVEYEEVILGTLLSEVKLAEIIFDKLSYIYFYKPLHQTIMKVAKELKEADLPIDIVTVSQHCVDNKIKNVTPYEISELTQKSSYNEMQIDFYITEIIDRYIKRSTIEQYQKIINKCYDQTLEVDEIIFEIDKSSEKLKNYIEYSQEKSTEDILIESIDKLEKACKLHKEGKVTGIPTPFGEFNNITAGFQETDLIILAARPGMGKTAFCMNLIDYIGSKQSKKIDMYSLEMSSQQLMDRLISLKTDTNLGDIRKGTIDEEDWNRIHNGIGGINNNILIDDSAGITLSQLVSKARKRKKERGTDIILIDYLQLMSGDRAYKGSREAEISDISRGLKRLAKELEIPIIALSQLSRAVETRGGNKKPMLSDLRESGSIEQDADMVLFLYRPEYYHYFEDSDGNNLRGLAELIIAKHRNGPLDTVKLKFIKRNATFVDPNDMEQNPF